MKTLKGKNVVITGAGGGIGRALALSFADEGCGLALSDIDGESLHGTESLSRERGARVYSRVLDVSDKEAMKGYPDKVAEALGGVDIVINNAGVVVVSSVEQHSIEDYEWLMGVNFWGVVYGCKFFIPHLRQSKDACIVNMSSVFGMLAMPHLSSYNAAKFAVRGFSESLAHELHGSSVRVMTVYPGGVRTDFVKKGRFGSTPGKKSHQEFNALFTTYSMSTPSAVSNAVIRGLKNHKKRVLVGPDAVSGDLVSRLFPVFHGRICRFIGSRV